jgi:hypothetical protein
VIRFMKKKKQMKERLVFSFEKWKKQFFYFEEKGNKSRIIREELFWIRKNQEVNLIFLKHYFLRSLLVENALEVRLVSGIVEKLKKKESINSVIILNHKIGRKERIRHKSFCYSLNLLGILPALIWNHQKKNIREKEEEREVPEKEDEKFIIEEEKPRDRRHPEKEDEKSK